MNAFGFGGTNAVCVIEKMSDGVTKTNVEDSIERCDVSICGIGAHFNDSYTSASSFLTTREEASSSCTKNHHHITKFNFSR